MKYKKNTLQIHSNTTNKYLKMSVENSNNYVDETPIFAEKEEFLKCLDVVCSKSYDVKKYEIFGKIIQIV